MSAAFGARCEAALLALLRERTKPLSAIEIAAACRQRDAGYWDNQGHETRRRRVREIIAELRSSGHRICAGVRIDEEATGQGGKEAKRQRGSEARRQRGVEVEIGYWIARSDDEWHGYLEAVRSKARYVFAVAREMSRAANDRTTGQQGLFADDPIAAGKRSAWAAV